VTSASGEGFQFTNANSAWIRKNYGILPAYTSAIQTKFAAEITPLEFKDTKADAGKINAWVDKNTQGKIHEILESSSIDADTRLILVNALYFKAEWEDPFYFRLTGAEDFHPAKGKVFKADFMHQSQRFSLIEKKEYDVLILPYKGRKQSLWLVLPKSGIDLDRVESELDEFKLEKSYKVDIESAKKEKKVALSLPKFAIVSNFKLAPYLQKLGIHRAFSVKDAELSGISKETPLYVSEIIQRATIDLDEEGTVASAATATSLKGGAGAYREPTIDLKFDRPFAYFLRDEATGKILFMGRVARPTEAKIQTEWKH
jgi:serpin B